MTDVRHPTSITDAPGVAAVADAARTSGRIALDFEFLWERTYAPIACLAQVAIGDDIALVDPIRGAPLEPISELVEDPSVEVVMHAPSADLQLLGLAFATRPRNLRDVQIAAGFAGLGAGQGLASLLARVLSVDLDKGERYTDWSRRPLSDAQLLYAAADVRHLIELYDALADRAREQGREGWVEEEVLRRFGPDVQLVPDPETAWRRVKGQGRLSPRERSRLRALAAWREREAAERDLPVGWILPDRSLVQLARRKPKSRDAVLGERGLPSRFRPSDADAVLLALAEGDAGDPVRLPAAPPPSIQARLETLVPLAAVLVGGRAAAADVAPSILATRDEITAFLSATLGADRDPGVLAEGWRAEVAGGALEELAAGRLALTSRPEPPYLKEIVPGTAGAGGAPAGGASAES